MSKLFEDTATAFHLKSNNELERAYYLFKMIASEPLVKMGTLLTNFAINAKLPVEGIIRATVFDHFCGGVTEEDCMQVIDNLYQAGVTSILDYSAEGKIDELQFQQAEATVSRVLNFVKEKEAIPFAVFKPSAFGPLPLFTKRSEAKPFTQQEESQWCLIENRYDAICKKAYNLEVSLLIDAEESWMQQAADDLAWDMMMRYNLTKAVVFNTAQMYRKDRLDYLMHLKEKAQETGVKVGIKLVRGAYMEKENQRAKDRGYPSPICSSKQATDDNFDKAIDFMVNHLDVFTIFLGTHNEQSTYLLLEKMEKLGLANNHPNIWFGQLYGMSDHISFNLAKAGYNVSKYLPYGPVRDVMPYLIRRAEENTSVAGQTTRELSLLKKERIRRKME